jgi:hypothetical protein
MKETVTNKHLLISEIPSCFSHSAPGIGLKVALIIVLGSNRTHPVIVCRTYGLKVLKKINTVCCRNQINPQIHFVFEIGLLTFRADGLPASENQ